jgi:hypothetical protein
LVEKCILNKITINLPDEFVLKKFIVALVITLNILLCKFKDAFIQTNTNIVDLMRVANIIINVITAKTMKQAFLEIVHQSNVSDISLVVNVLFSAAVNILLFTLSV